MKIGDIVKIQKNSGEFCRAKVSSINSFGATVMFYENGYETY
ncbi:unnamed protein product, partial [Brachionus calyciflorus]